MATRQTNFTRPTLKQLNRQALATANAKLPQADARLRNSVLNVLCAIIAEMANGLYGYINYVARQVIIFTADDEYLDYWGNTFGVKRKIAAFGEGHIAVTGATGAVLPVNTPFKRADGVVYLTAESITMPAAGSTDVAVKAEKVGQSGNAEANVKVSLVSPVTGIATEALVATGGITGGTTIETAEAFRTRILTRIQKPPAGGSKDDYERWTLEVPGVTRAWCTSAEMGAGTVTVRFMMDNTYANGIPLAADVARVAEYLNDPERKIVTPEIFVVAPIAHEINIGIRNLTPDTPETRAAAQNELADLFAREAYPGCTVYVSKIWEAVSIAVNTEHFTLTAPAGDMVMETANIPILGTITYN